MTPFIWFYEVFSHHYGTWQKSFILYYWYVIEKRLIRTEHTQQQQKTPLELKMSH